MYKVFYYNIIFFSIFVIVLFCDCCMKTIDIIYKEQEEESQDDKIKNDSAKVSIF